jgi:hypothetical protein
MPAMTGNYSRFTFDPRNRFSGVLEQQGRVQLDADWNEAVAIFKRRIQVQALDTFGPFGVPELTTPNAFEVKVVAGAPLDLSLDPGRIYVDGILAEIFPDETASYLKQPFFPDPPPLPAGDAVVYLDLWEREVTYIEDRALLDSALGGVDTATRTQNVWQLKADRVDAPARAVCGMPVGAPASAGRLSTEAIALPAPDDPCILPPVAGYRGLENRLYRVEVHTGGVLGTARFKWSRDNGSIVSAVSDIAVSGGRATLTVDRLGRDQVLRFAVGNWITVTDDFREFAGEPGDMARIVGIDEANAKIVLDRGLPATGGRAFGANAAESAARHTRVQRWDQTAATNTVDADGLIATAAGPINIEEGVRVRFATEPVGDAFRGGDYWVFWARTATASIEILDREMPRGIVHHYMQLAAASGLGTPFVSMSDCRPTKKAAEQCCCTFVVAPGQDIQKAIEALPPAGGCVCLKTGLHQISQTLTIDRNDVRLIGESPGTTVRVLAPATALLIRGRAAVQDVAISGIAFEREVAGDAGAVIEVVNARRVLIEDCVARSLDPPKVVGVAIQNVQALVIARCLIEQVESGIWILGKDNLELTFTDNLLTLTGQSETGPGFGILAQQVQSALRIENNVIQGGPNGILVNDTLGAAPSSFTLRAEIVGNAISCAAAPAGTLAGPPAYGIDVAAHESSVSRNLVVLPNRPTAVQTGIRLTGAGLRARDNDVLVPFEAARNNPPVGIEIGYSADGATALTTDIEVHGNTVGQCPVAIVVTAVSGADIAGNSLEMAGSAAGLGSAGITLDTCVGVDVHDNRLVGFFSGISSKDGVTSRIAANIIKTGEVGVALIREITPVVTQSRITDMARAAILASDLTGRCDLTDNRIAHCAYSIGAPASIAVTRLTGELRIAGNEVIDSGLSLNGTSNAPVSGIMATLVQEATVDGNQVTYTEPKKRDPTAEDRALVMGGLIERPAEADTILGFPVQILGNKFIGAGNSALIELLETRIGDQTFVRFERVIFSNNYCLHLINEGLPQPLPVGTATVRLTGRAASVLGNQIKADIRRLGVPSVDFNNMPGPFMGNVTTSPPTRHADLPSPVSAFNLTL